MTARLLGEILVNSIAALTPAQRLEAMRRLNRDIMTEGWFIAAGLGAIVILSVLLSAVSIRRIRQERAASDRLFEQFARSAGLTGRETEILFEVVRKAGLSRSEGIFTMEAAFDGGAERLVDEFFGSKVPEEEIGRLKTELSFLREKLGFQKHPLSAVAPALKTKNPSSRQIPVGKKVSITRRRSPDRGAIEATVARNNDIELSLEPAVPVESVSGEIWRAHYQFGASVWEFDASVVRCEDRALVFNHSDNVRFINRRRFVRVPVSLPAMIAAFPFSREEPGGRGGGGAEGESGEVSGVGKGRGLPVFIPATITELAGPGLRIEAEVDLKVGDRVLVIFRLDGGKVSQKGVGAKIIEDIGEVRHKKEGQGVRSIAVELIGLSDSDINELVCLTNAACLKAGRRSEAEEAAGGPAGAAESLSVRGG